MAENQTAWRHVATRVAHGASPSEIFETVAEEVGRLLNVASAGLVRFENDGSVTLVGGWGRYAKVVRVGARLPSGGVNVTSEIAHTGRFARYGRSVRATGPVGESARNLDIREVAGSPVMVDDRLWGAIVVGADPGRTLPVDVERQLTQFAESMATTIATAQARADLALLVAEQAALRRVATLVAENGSAAALFAKVAQEVASLFGRQVESWIIRYEPDNTATALAVSGSTPRGGIQVGGRHPVNGDGVTARVFRERRPVRIDDYTTAAGVIADHAKLHGWRCAVGCPILVQGRLWGVMFIAHCESEPFPAGTEQRITQFTELMATAIANAQTRTDLRLLLDEQAALRRVATLVAENGSAAALFAKVAEEVASLFGGHVESWIGRYEPDDTATALAGWGETPHNGLRVGMRLPVDGTGVTARVYRERRAVRIDDYAATTGTFAERSKPHAWSAAVGCPILVRGRLWGVMVVAHRKPEPFHGDAEQRVTQFSELVATAIANTQAQTELQRLLDEQASLRRLAMLVAQGAGPTEVFDAVVVELGSLIGPASVGLLRADGADEALVLAHRGQPEAPLRPGTRVALDGDSATARVLRTGSCARIDSRTSGGGTIADLARDSKHGTAAAAPVMVNGRVWGALTGSWRAEGEQPPADVEQRLGKFAELVATTIANADNHNQLTASRARVLSAGDEARRRVVRDLHDGAQQRLVHAIITLKLAQRALDGDAGRAGALLAEALDHAEQGNADLRELAHGILPSILARGGLRAGIDGIASRLDLPVELDVTSTRFPSETEASGYFIVAEALTNVVKHARATRAMVRVSFSDATLRIEMSDDGIGGADPEGHGLTGISDRVAALGGSLHIDSPRGGGTMLLAQLPVPI